MIKSRIAVVGAIVALVAGCAGTSSSSTSSTPSSHDEGGSVEWSYSGPKGPENWGSLSAEYSTCSTGKQQSPVNIVNPQPVSSPDAAAEYEGNSAKIFNNGHSVEALAENAGSFAFAGKDYELEQVHYHAPSETEVNGKKYPIEFHFVNAASDGSVAVFAQFVTVGAQNSAWEPFISAAATAPLTHETAAPISLDWAKLTASANKSYRFMGSLTTPPCTEGLQWVVASKPITMSQSQINQLTAIYDGNDRPIQALNGRSLTVDSQ